MTDWIVNNESTLRASAFFFMLMSLVLWEYMQPARVLTLSRWVRWRANLLLMLVNTLTLRLVVPIAAVGSAVWASNQEFGLLYWLGFSNGLAMLIAIICLDLVIYWQHRLMHKLPILWRLHQVHHADLDMDVTTALRFHTLEMVLSMAIKCAVVILLGVPVFAVIVFEVILNASAMFNHSNLQLASSVDKQLRKWIVTPDMHRVHHSTAKAEQNTNYGFFLSFWDRLFHSYCAYPAKGQKQMEIGIAEQREAKDVASFKGVILMPFKRIG